MEIKPLIYGTVIVTEIRNLYIFKMHSGVTYTADSQRALDAYNHHRDCHNGKNLI